MTSGFTLPVVLLCVCLVLAGCQGVPSPFDSPSDSGPTVTPSALPEDPAPARQRGGTESEREQDGSTEKTTLAPLKEPANHPGLTANLQVVVSTDDRVRITVTEQSNRGTVYNETFAERTYVRFGDGRVFRENGAYRVEIRVEGDVAWNTTVKHFESYDLRVAENGSVLIEEYYLA